MSNNRFTRFLPPEDYEKLRTKYPKFNEPWDDNDIEELKKMYADGQPVQAMAEQLGRTPNSLRLRLKALGLWEAPPAPKQRLVATCRPRPSIPSRRPPPHFPACGLLTDAIY